MTHRFRVAHAAGICLVAFATAIVASLWIPSGGVRTADRNGDGWPDVWRSYDAHGVIAELTLDTNFDGRSDVREYYEHGALVRRESDRDFNDRVDLVQRFNASTRQHESSIVDVDADGSADLLVLFRDGRPVFSKWAQAFPRATSAAEGLAQRNSRSAARAWALTNPFASDLALQGLDASTDDERAVGLSTCGGLPAPGAAISRPFDTRSALLVIGAAILAPMSAASHSPRGPPTFTALST